MAVKCSFSPIMEIGEIWKWKGYGLGVGLLFSEPWEDLKFKTGMINSGEEFMIVDKLTKEGTEFWIRILVADSGSGGWIFVANETSFFSEEYNKYFEFILS